MFSDGDLSTKTNHHNSSSKPLLFLKDWTDRGSKGLQNRRHPDILEGCLEEMSQTAVK